MMYLNKEIHLKLNGLDNIQEIIDRANQHLAALRDTLEELSHAELQMEAFIDSTPSQPLNSESS